MIRRLFVSGFILVAGALGASPGHLEGYVPAIARTAGGFGSDWRTDAWIYTQDATIIHLWFNASGSDHTSEQSVPIALTPGVLYMPDLVENTFHTQGFGSLHYLANAPVEVTTRTWTPGATGGGYGQTIRGIPLQEAGFAGTELRFVANQEGSSRVNLGVVNVSSDLITAKVEIFLPDGGTAPGDSTFEVTLPPFDMTQVNDLFARLDPGTREGLIVRVSLASGAGGILAYLSQADNTTNDPSYQEAFRFE